MSDPTNRNLNIPKLRSKVVRGGKVLPPTDKNSYDKFYREYQEEEKTARKSRTSFSEAMTAIEMELLDIVEKVRSAVDHKQSDIQVRRLNDLGKAFASSKLGKNQKEYIRKQIEKTRNLVNKERKTLVGDIIKKTRKTANQQLKRSTKAIAKAVKSGVSEGASRVTALIDDEISNAIGDDKILAEAYELSKKGMSVLGGIAAKPLKAIGSKIFGKSSGGVGGPSSQRSSSSGRSYKSYLNDDSGDSATIDPEIKVELSEQTTILKTHTNLLERISKDSVKSSKAVEKAAKLAEKAAKDKKRYQFQEEEDQHETSVSEKKKGSNNGGIFSLIGKTGILGKIFGGNKSTTTPEGEETKGILSSTTDFIQDSLLSGLAIKGLLGKKIPGLGLLSKGKNVLGGILSRTGSGVASGLGKAGKFLFSKAGGAALYGVTQSYGAYDAIHNKEERGRERGSSSSSSAVADIMHNLTFGVGELIATRKDTARQLDMLKTMVSNNTPSFFSGSKDKPVSKEEEQRERESIKVFNNVKEITKLKDRVKNASPSDIESIRQQERRIRDLEEENQRLQNKWLKEEMIKKEKAEEEVAVKKIEESKSWTQRTSDFFSNAYKGAKEKLGISSPTSAPDTSSMPGNISYKPLKKDFDSIIDKEFKNFTPELRAAVDKYAKKYNVSPALAYAVIGQESGGDPNAVSETGVRGAMQVTKSLARSYGLDRDDPEQNIEAGIRYIAELSKQFNGDLNQVMAYYNGGDEYAKRAKAGRSYEIRPGKDRENDGHYRGIMKRFEKYKEMLEDEVVVATSESVSKDQNRIKTKMSELESLISGQPSEQQQMFSKMQEQGKVRDAKEQGRMGQGPNQSVVAPSSNAVVNNNYNSSVVQSNLRHTESSFVREQEKMWSIV